MSTVDSSLRTTVWRRTALDFRRTVTQRPRAYVYPICTALAVVACYLLGKDMLWDTLDYHLYAGFSALHDRLELDYFAAGTQSYLNPYVYVPFYALVRTGLPALWIASVLAMVHSAILWLTYELTIAVYPSNDRRACVVAGVCAALLAIANPILINQLGTSYADITTAEVVLAAWLLLIQAVKTPSAARVACAGLLLGTASALKLTNSVHALSACVLLLFIPLTWRSKLRLAIGFGTALALAFAVAAGPWALRLEHQFGNPFFPLLNGVFRSPQFPTAPMFDSRFVPSSFVVALWRPFAIAAPVAMVDDEFSSPDLRYAVLLILAGFVIGRWLWLRLRPASDLNGSAAQMAGSRTVMALGCAFLLDWTLWLRASGNGRYFLAMACVAGVLAVALAFRACCGRPKVLAYLFVAIFSVQGLQLIMGTSYRLFVAWDGGKWFEIHVPRALTQEPALYFTVGEQTNSFIAPFLGEGSALVDLDGDYVLGPGGANGAHIDALIRKYTTHIRVLALDQYFKVARAETLPDATHVNDTLALFGLRADTNGCASVTVRDMRYRWRNVLPGTLPVNLPQLNGRMIRVPVSPDGQLVACPVVRDAKRQAALAISQREPNLVFERVEDACPLLFEPRRPVTQAYGDSRSGYLWMRKYPDTNLTLLIARNSIKLVDGVRGGQPEYLGTETEWAKAALPLICGRRGQSYFARKLPPSR